MRKLVTALGSIMFTLLMYAPVVGLVLGLVFKWGALFIFVGVLLTAIQASCIGVWVFTEIEEYGDI